MIAGAKAGSGARRALCGGAVLMALATIIGALAAHVLRDRMAAAPAPGPE